MTTWGRVATVLAVFLGAQLSPAQVDARAPAPAPFAQCSPGYHSAWLDQSAYPSLAPGQIATVTIRFRNIGCETWGTNLRLGTSTPTPGQNQPSVLGGATGCPTVTNWAACDRIAPESYNIGYNGIAAFTFQVKGQPSAGSARVYLRPLIETVAWMEDQGVYMQVDTLICTNRALHDDVARYVITTAAANATIMSSSILEYDPYYTAFNRTGTNASVLLVRQGTPFQWAQLGWTKHAQGGPIEREVFTEFFVSPTDNRWQFWPAEPVGTETWYQIQFAAPDRFDFFVKGAWRHFEAGMLPPNDVQAFGETHDWADQMPGGVNNHVRFVNTQYYAGGWVTLTSPLTVHEPSIHAGSNPSLGRYESWDKGCAN
jgi:hypothetical protein